MQHPAWASRNSRIPYNCKLCLTPYWFRGTDVINYHCVTFLCEQNTTYAKSVNLHVKHLSDCRTWKNYRVGQKEMIFVGSLEIDSISIEN